MSLSDYVGPTLGVFGVGVGAWLSKRSGEVTRLRDLRVERYSAILEQLDTGTMVVDNLLGAFSRPGNYESEVAWQADLEKQGAAIAESALAVRIGTARTSLYSSAEVNARISDILEAWKIVLGGFAQAEEPSEAAVGGPVASVIGPDHGGTEAPDSPGQVVPITEGENELSHPEQQPVTWPRPDVVEAARHFSAAQADTAEALSGLRRQLVGAMRADLGIDVLRPWNRWLRSIRAVRARRRANRADPAQ